MSDPVPQEILDVFAEEAVELIEGLGRAVLLLEGDSAEERQHGLQDLRRFLHTVKGSAGSIGLAVVSELCHQLETELLDLDPAPGIAPRQADLLHRAVSAIEAGCGGDDAPAQALLASGLSLAALAGDAEGEVDTVDAAPVEEDATAPAAAPPEAEPAEGDAGDDEVDDDGPSRRQFPPRPAPARRETVRVAVSKLDALQSAVSELVVTRLQTQTLVDESDEIQRQARSVGREWRTLAAELRTLRSALPPGARGQLESGLGAFSRAIRRLERSTFQWHRRGTGMSSQLRVVTDTLEDGIQKARMMPLGPYFSGFAVAVREAARACGVDARLTWTDRGIEADRMILERLRDPLLHLLRNAVAHGIEPAAQREAAGKDPVGAVRIVAERRTREVEIRVIDDGRGIDRASVKQRALERGLVEPDAVIDDELLTTLLTTPGLSTASDVGQVAGRGIGLNVVAERLHDLQGTLAIESVVGSGTSFVLRMPASVTTTQGMVLRVGPYTFGIPLSAVERVIDTNRDMISTLEDQAVVYVDGSPLTITSLADLVGSLEHGPADDGDSSPTLILRVGRRRLAVIVEEIPGELPMVVRPLGAQFERVGWLGGAAMQGDGSVLPLLEPRGLFEVASHRRRTVARIPEDAAGSAADARAERRDRSLRVLVVDDSLTMRALNRNILEAAGYEVVLAADGLEAQDRLRADPGIELVITDLDMPRIDGFELCRWIRSGPFADLPVLMVTSLDSDEEKRRGLEAGADAYIVKGNFRQDHFLATVRRLGGE